MELPSFEEFLTTLSPEDYADLSGKEEFVMYRVKTPLTDEDLNVLTQELTSAVAVASGRFSIKLLKRYHSWLSQYFAEL